jgi:dTDP-L-rhamnose 4-epimerase
VKRVLVTGGAGFIGSHLSTALLAGGVQVRILDPLSQQVHGPVPSGLDWLNRDGIEFIRAGVESRDALRQALAGADAVVHLAAETGTGQSMYRIEHYNAVNVQGTAALLDVLANDEKRTVKRIVLASSRSVYGEGAYVCETCSPERRVFPDPRPAAQLAAHRWEPSCPSCGQALTAVPTREDDRVNPASIYAATKLAQEDLVRIACDTMGMGYAILRLQNVYGEGQSLTNPYTGILSIFSTRIRRGLQLPIFEDGQETRDFVHVADVADALAAALRVEPAPNAIINVGTGRRASVAEIAALLAKALGATPDLLVTGQYRLGDIRHNYADIGRLRRLIGREPRLGLAEGLARFAAWVKAEPLPEDQLDRANAELRGRKMMG